MLRSVLHDEPFEDAKEAIEAVRQVEFYKSIPRIGGPWIEEAIHGSWNNDAHGLPDCWVASTGASKVHACRVEKGKLAPLCKGHQRDALDFFKSDVLRADTVEEARKWGRSLCPRCAPLLRCSLEAQIRGWRG